MNIKSLRRIEEVIKQSGKWSSLEIAQESIYLEFTDVELGNPEDDEDFTLSIRFADDSFIMFFYNNIWDIDFLANFDYANLRILEDFDFKIENIRFLDFEFLDNFFKKYPKNKAITQNSEFDIHNIRNDFFVIFEIENVGVVVGGNQMDFFNKSEKLDDFSLKELSNQWMVYFLEYNSKRNIINKDNVCENSSLK